jgi:hypothetical protein
MADSSTKTKTVSIRLPNKELGQVDAYALANGLNRSQAILEILRKGLDDGGAGDIAAARLDTVVAKLDALAASQAAHAALLADAIKNQPIAVQQQELPAPEVTDADVQAYIRARRPDIELDVFGDPAVPKRKGLVSRILGRG